MDVDALKTATAELQGRVVEDLSRLVRIPSIAFPGYDEAPVRASAEATAEILQAAGYGGVRLIELPNVDHPAVFGEIAGPAGSPTLLLYAHHDVQPEGPLEEWTSPPFEPVVRDGRLFGRGTSDDKCGIVGHAAALAAWEGKPPVTLKVLVEGEEEASDAHLPFLIGEHVDLLAADVVGVADGGNWRNGVPTLEASTRGVVDCRVTVRVLDHAIHSGSYGGPSTDALSALARLLSTLQDEDGEVAIDGLMRQTWDGMEVTEEDYRKDAPLRPGIRLIGSGPIAERIWTKPSVAVLGIDAPRVTEASNQLVPSATAKVSLRLAPDEDPKVAMDALTRHLVDHAPWGVGVEIGEGTSGRGIRIRTDGPGFAAMRRAMEAAFGRPIVVTGSGGSVPLVPVLVDAMPDAEILFYGASDEMSRYHSTDESVDLGELERTCLAEALLLGELGRAA